MKSVILLFPILLLVFVLSGRIDARIINVPEDFETIQGAIDEAEDGDTVLVQPGEYVENIRFRGRAITVASLILTTSNPAYIDSTIIDGDENGSVVRFVHQEDENSILRGFTVRNGLGSLGGGIDCGSARPTLKNLVIVDNVATSHGGGIHCCSNSSPTMEDLVIVDNESQGHAGGIIFCGASPTLTRITIRNNTAARRGGGIWGRSGASEFMNCTICNNSAEEGGGIYFERGDPPVLNSIIWANEPDQIQSWEGVEISWSNIEDGWEGEGNISEDPLFVDPDEGDYHLTVFSPCIDAGDPESPEDPDGSRVDMGAFPFFHNGFLHGFVLDAEDNNPLAGALLIMNYGIMALTDTSGYFEFQHALNHIEFDLTASFAGYNDSTIAGLIVEMDDTLEVFFRLLHPEFNVNPDEIRATLMQGESTEIDVTITNNGNGPLVWMARPRGHGGFEPWELRQSIDVSEIVNDSRIEGVVFVDSLFYVVGANRTRHEDEPDVIYILNKDGELIDTLPQPEGYGGRYGMRDIAWDGEHIWGSGEERIYGLNLEGEVEREFDGPYGNNHALAWDPDREALWVSTITQGIAGVNREDGEVVARLDRKGFRIYGLAYWEDDPDGYPLYIFHNPGGGSQHVHKMNPVNGDTMFAADLGSQAEGTASGAFITNQYDVYSWVFINIANDGAEDRIDIWQLGGMTCWMQVEPDDGLVEADADQNIDFTIDATDLDVRVYEGILEFIHNAAGGSVSVPVTLTVTASSVTDRGSEVPVEFGIVDVYPNPFNSTAHLRFTLPNREHVILRLYDILGREVTELLDEDMSSGRHYVTVSAEKLATGVYIARLEGLSNAAFMKLVVIK